MAIEIKRIYQRNGIANYSSYTKSKILQAGEKIYFNTIITGEIGGPYSITGDNVNQIDALPFCETVKMVISANADISAFRIAGNVFQIANNSAGSLTVNIGTSGSPVNYTLLSGQSSQFSYLNGMWHIVDSSAPSSPLGSIIGWHKNLTGGLPIPYGWVECNGQVLSDSSSVYNGQTIPDLNGDSRFLRGSLSSGNIQQDAFQGHYIFVYPREGDEATWNINNPFTFRHTTGAATTAITRDNNTGPYLNNYIGQGMSFVSDGTNGTPRIDNETRPVNMSVVWIMRVK